MKNAEQKYATRVFNNIIQAESFKISLGNLCKQTIKQDKLGRYKVRWLIDKSRPIEINRYTQKSLFKIKCS
jgi:hypothetical protein